MDVFVMSGKLEESSCSTCSAFSEGELSKTVVSAYLSTKVQKKRLSLW